MHVPTFSRRPTSLLAAVATALLVTAPLTAQDRPLVVIDPGHGGAEDGVVAGDIVEKDLILRVAFAMGAEFVAAGYDVHFTRTRDVAVEWDDRRGQAEEAGAVALIMLHAMQSEDPDDRGAEIYFDETNGPSTTLSTAAADALRALGSPVLVDPRPWPFLQSASVPTTMIELAHLTNPGDRENMLDATYHHTLGQAMVAAVEELRGG
ncbi:MAG TPA: N-acetylmuramoyl-L-alanine amidase [Longimicrobiales bacterium]|nr:N-acetylmuramoyl-L-alanine amidase [Longimicrobiales bacterium]